MEEEAPVWGTPRKETLHFMYKYLYNIQADVINNKSTYHTILMHCINIVDNNAVMYTLLTVMYNTIYMCVYIVI